LEGRASERDGTLDAAKGNPLLIPTWYSGTTRSCRRADVPKPTSRGLRWLSAMVLVDVPFSGRIWALPVLTALTPSKAR